MTDDHVVSAPGDLDPGELARAIVTRPGMYIGMRPSTEAVRAFISGLDLAALVSTGASPVTEGGHRRLRDLSADDLETVEPVLVELLSRLRGSEG